MAGTKAGGHAAATTNKLKYGAGFYARIGQIGGRNGHDGGFASRVACDCDYRGGISGSSHVKAECAGAKGGTISRRGKKHD